MSAERAEAREEDDEPLARVTPPRRRRLRLGIIQRRSHDGEADANAPARTSRFSNALISVASMRMPRPALMRRVERQPRTVRLHIYRLTNVVLDATLSALLGGGVYHSGVELDGIEYGFGWHATSETGVWMQQPTELPNGFAGGGAKLIRSIDAGTVTLAPATLRERIVRMMQEWPGESYDALRHNCNHFSAALIACALESTEPYALPPWVNAIAGVGSAVFGAKPGSPARGPGSKRSPRGLNGAFAHPGATHRRRRGPIEDVASSEDVASQLSLNFVPAGVDAQVRSTDCLGCMPRWYARPRVHPSSEPSQAADYIAARVAALGRSPLQSLPTADAELATQSGFPPRAEAAPSAGDATDSQVRTHVRVE
jgi:hypothetical protein